MAHRTPHDEAAALIPPEGGLDRKARAAAVAQVAAALESARAAGIEVGRLREQWQYQQWREHSLKALAEVEPGKRMDHLRLAEIIIRGVYDERDIPRARPILVPYIEALMDDARSSALRQAQAVAERFAAGLPNGGERTLAQAIRQQIAALDTVPEWRKPVLREAEEMRRRAEERERERR